MTAFKYRDYQSDAIRKAQNILTVNDFVYLSMEVRTGKTLTAFGIADVIGAERVLFITKKKAISSINDDYDLLQVNGKANFNLVVINYESLHKIPQLDYDLIVMDEAHSCGAFPKPSKRVKELKEISKRCCTAQFILLSGTPTPESYSQMYHQVCMIPNNPFSKYKNFYAFAKDYVDVKQKRLGSMVVNDYSAGKESILDEVRHHMVSVTQKQAGFRSKIKEHFHEVQIDRRIQTVMDKLTADRVFEGKNNVILADTPVKLLSKFHQLSSGTIKFDDGSAVTICKAKAQYIYDNFSTGKHAIFYKFKQELEALRDVYGKELTTDLEEFYDDPTKNIALQFLSGREGVSLKQADNLVMYNVDFSATTYWQARDRMTTKDRAINNVHWIFSDIGIENDIYKAVSKKKDYTLNHFKRSHLGGFKQKKMF